MDQETFKYIKSHYVADYETGIVYSLTSRNPALRQVGKKNVNGYITLNGKLHAHQAVWCLFHNCPIPEGMEIDHVSGERDNNSISNLRLASRTQNKANSPAYKNRDCKGVYATKGGKYRAVASGIYLGTFTNIDDASEAYDCAAIMLFGEFALLNAKKRAA